MSDAIRINGNQFTWASIELRIAGVPYYGATSVNFTQTKEFTLNYGLGKHYGPRGRGEGKYSAEGSIEMYMTTWAAVRDALAQSVDGINYGRAEFVVTVSYFEDASSEVPMTFELLGCRVAGVEISHAEGTEGLKVNIPLSILYIKEGDNKSLFFNDGSL